MSWIKDMALGERWKPPNRLSLESVAPFYGKVYYFFVVAVLAENNPILWESLFISNNFVLQVALPFVLVLFAVWML